MEAPGLMRQNNSRNGQFYLLVMYIFSIMEENHTVMSRQEVQPSYHGEAASLRDYCRKGAPLPSWPSSLPHSGQAHLSSMLCQTALLLK